MDILITMGTMMGRDFFLDNMFNTVLRPFLNLQRYDIRKLVPFTLSLLRGVIQSFKGKQQFSREGSGARFHRGAHLDRFLYRQAPQAG